jgi:hypothetical protein
MFHMKANRRSFLLRKAAILAPHVSPLAYEFADRRIHDYSLP